VKLGDHVLVKPLQMTGVIIQVHGPTKDFDGTFYTVELDGNGVGDWFEKDLEVLPAP
jgi:hypothetical protein